MKRGAGGRGSFVPDKKGGIKSAPNVMISLQINMAERMTIMVQTIHSDTIELLRECNAGVKMGVDSIEDVIDKVESERLLDRLNRAKDEHQQLGSEIHANGQRYVLGQNKRYDGG